MLPEFRVKAAKESKELTEQVRRLNLEAEKEDTNDLTTTGGESDDQESTSKGR
jgi:hypothetical protein